MPAAIGCFLIRAVDIYLQEDIRKINCLADIANG